MAERAAARASASAAAASGTTSVVTAFVVATTAAVVEVGPAYDRIGAAKAGLRGIWSRTSSVYPGLSTG